MKKRKGFTLVELVIVVAFIAVLVTIAVPRYTDFTESAKISAFTANHSTLISAQTAYISAHGGALPASESDLLPYLSNTSNLSGLGPGGATYNVTNGVITSTLTGLRSGTDLVLTFTP